MKILVCELLARCHKLSQNHKSKIINLPVYLLCIVFKNQSPSGHLFNIASAKREHKSQRRSRILGNISQSLLFSSTWWCTGKLPWAHRAPRASADLVVSAGGPGKRWARVTLLRLLGTCPCPVWAPSNIWDTSCPCLAPLPPVHFCRCRDRALPI